MLCQTITIQFNHQRLRQVLVNCENFYRLVTAKKVTYLSFGQINQMLQMIYWSWTIVTVAIIRKAGSLIIKRCQMVRFNISNSKNIIIIKFN